MINDYLAQKIADAFLTKRIYLSYLIAVTILRDRCTIGMTTPGGMRFDFEKGVLIERLRELNHSIEENSSFVLTHEDGCIKFSLKGDVVRIMIYTKYFGFKIPTNWSKTEKRELLIKIEEVISS